MNKNNPNFRGLSKEEFRAEYSQVRVYRRKVHAARVCWEYYTGSTPDVHAVTWFVFAPSRAPGGNDPDLFYVSCERKILAREIKSARKVVNDYKETYREYVELFGKGSWHTQQLRFRQPPVDYDLRVAARKHVYIKAIQGPVGNLP